MIYDYKSKLLEIVQTKEFSKHFEIIAEEGPVHIGLQLRLYDGKVSVREERVEAARARRGSRCDTKN